MDLFTHNQWAVGLLVIVMLALLAWLADFYGRSADAERAAALAADTSTKTTALAQGWLVQFKSGGSRWLPCLAASSMAFAIFPSPAEAESYRDKRIKSEAERRKLVGDTGDAPASIFRIVRARLEFA